MVWEAGDHNIFARHKACCKQSQGVATCIVIQLGACQRLREFASSIQEPDDRRRFLLMSRKQEIGESSGRSRRSGYGHDALLKYELEKLLQPGLSTLQWCPFYTHFRVKFKVNTQRAKTMQFKILNSESLEVVTINIACVILRSFWDEQYASCENFECVKF